MVPYGEGQESYNSPAQKRVTNRRTEIHKTTATTGPSFLPFFPPACFFLKYFFPCHLPFPSQSISSHFQTRANSAGIHHTCCCFHGTAAMLSAKLISHQFPLPPLPASWNNRSFLSPSSLPPSPTHMGNTGSLAGRRRNPPSPCSRPRTLQQGHAATMCVHS